MKTLERAQEWVKQEIGILPDGILKIEAKLKVPCAKKIQHIEGFDYIVSWDSGCLHFHAGMPPLGGRTTPRPVPCPIGHRVIKNIEIDAENAINIMKQKGCWEHFAEMALFWPMTSGCSEPLWFFRAGKRHAIIGAHSGSMEESSMLEAPHLGK